MNELFSEYDGIIYRYYLADEADHELINPNDIKKILSRLESQLNGNDDGKYLDALEIYHLRIKDIVRLLNATK